MDKKDGRRSRVPAGTFGGSEPPPAPVERRPPVAVESPAGQAEPPRFVNTLVGEGAVAREAPSGTPDENDPSDMRRPHVSTIVGRPSAPPVVAPGPLLAPPKWRGAKPYLEGEEPQPRLSSIPTPPPIQVGEPVAAPEAARSRVTTKMGPAPAPEPAPVPLRAASAAIGDTIQEMLDGQASVPMQVEEPSDEALEEIPIEELPIEEVPIDEILESFAEPEPVPAPAVTPAPPRAAASPPTPPPVPAAVSALEFDAIDRQTSPRPPPPTESHAKIAQIALVTRPASSMRDGHATPTSAVGSAKQTRERPAPAEPAARKEPGPVSSLAPAEVSGRSRADDAQAGLGLALVAAMVLIGVGGWFLTRGGYPGPRPVVGAPQPNAAAAPAAAPVPASAQPAPLPASPSVQPELASSARVASDERQNSAAKRARLGTKVAPPSPREQSAPAPVASEPRAVLKVTPHDQVTDLPDLPSRDDVLAALAPIRAGVSECAHGQHGMAQVDITVASTGFVTHAVVDGDFAGTPEGSCIARTARRAQFVAFRKPTFRVIYPFSL